MISEIENRRSIRKYTDTLVSQQAIEEILRAGMLAPSSKNRQPWKFIVVTGDSKAEMLLAMKRGLQREKIEPLLPESAQYIAGAEYTMKIMEQAPAIIFIVNTRGLALHQALSPEERVYEICNAQSIGAAIENMTLAATEQNLGSLWVCDTYFAYPELQDWLNTDGELFAAMTIGYAQENPPARPRKKMEEVVEWRK